MRPSCHCATPCPCSAAYCSEFNARAFSPARSASVPARKASTGVGGTMAGDGVPSSDSDGDGASAKPTPITAAETRTLAIRIARPFRSAARMGHRAADRGADLLGVLPQRAGAELRLARLPSGLALVQLVGAELDVERAVVG